MTEEYDEKAEGEERELEVGFSSIANCPVFNYTPNTFCEALLFKYCHFICSTKKHQYIDFASLNWGTSLDF